MNSNRYLLHGCRQRTLHRNHRLFCVVSTWLVVVAFGGFADFVSASDVEFVRVGLVDTPISTSCRGIATVSADEVWVTGAKGTVIHTTDAGKRWRRVTVPDAETLDFRDVGVLPNGTVVVMSAGTGAASRVYRSGDYGESWQLVLQNREERGFFNGFEFDSTNRIGMLVGDPIDRRLEIYMTTDAGKTWQPWPRHECPELSEHEYGFAASGSGLAFTRSYIWIATGGSRASVWRRLRSAGWWDRQATPIRSGATSTGIFSICMTDDNHGVIIGGDYEKPERATRNVAFTNDGGKTWRAHSAQKMPHKACVRPLGVGKEGFLAVGRTGIAISTDGGNTWRHVSDESFYTLDTTADGRFAWAAGVDGRVARIVIVPD